MIAAEYVLPLRWDDGRDPTELGEYLRELARVVDVTVVDGSEEEAFARHAAAWGGAVRHVRPDGAGGNGKVHGVLTGLRLAGHERVVIADDDVRYTPETLAAVLGRLRDADLVSPQNVFTSSPWHARWDTARSLLNRAVCSDYPGTLAVRRSLILDAGGYATDVLFENLELMRTVRAAGGRVRHAPDIYVGRRPPTVRHFLGQRVRQAYDDLAQPARLVRELALLPLVVAARRRPPLLVAASLATVVLAEVGRRRHGGRAVYPATASAWAPLWLAERAVCVWLALGARLRGGVRYGRGRLRRAAHSERRLAARLDALGVSAG